MAAYFGSLDTSTTKRLRRFNSEDLVISYPTDSTNLPEGTVVKLLSTGKVAPCAAGTDKPFGVVLVSPTGTTNNDVRAGYASVLVFGIAECDVRITGNATPTTELASLGYDSGTGEANFKVAVTGDYVVAISTATTAANAVGRAVLLKHYYVK